MKLKRSVEWAELLEMRLSLLNAELECVAEDYEMWKGHISDIEFTSGKYVIEICSMYRYLESGGYQAIELETGEDDIFFRPSDYRLFEWDDGVISFNPTADDRLGLTEKHSGKVLRTGYSITPHCKIAA